MIGLRSKIPLMLVVWNPAALAWATSVWIDEAMGSLVKVMLDHAAASSLAFRALPVSAASAVLASAWALAGDALRNAVVASCPLSSPVTTLGWAERKLVLTTSTVVENWPLGHWVFSLTSTWPWPSETMRVAQGSGTQAPAMLPRLE